MVEPYRVVVVFDPERSVFVARAPELEACVAEGATRAEALAKVEEEVAAVLAHIAAGGGQPPEPLDRAPLPPGPLALKVSDGLRRELVFQARIEGIELDALAGELLAGALEARRSRGRGRPQREDGPRQDRGPGGFGRRGEQSPRYHDIMEDRASFVEYVRQLESGGRPGGAPRGPGGGGRGPAGGGRGPAGGGRGGRGPCDR
jgi:predicted RNase H-like HicB family nuclease